MADLLLNHFQLTDDEYEEQFRNCTFKPRLFSHEAHLRLAWIHITKYGLEQAEINLCEDIYRFANHVNYSDKFNKTITIASAKIMDNFMRKSSADSFQDFAKEFPRLIHDFKEILGYHYRMDIFKNDEAKKTYLKPDLLPF